jgi:hypothetical protein
VALTDNERGAAINFRDGKNNTLINRGTVGDTSDLTRMAVLGEIGNEAITNFGVFAGNINLGGGTNTLTNQAGATVLSGPNLSLGAGGILTNNGSLSIGRQNSVAVTSLTGSISQSSAARLLVDLDFTNMSADRINISGGNAALAGSVVLNRMHIETIKPGTQSLTLVSASGGVTASGVTLSVDSSAVTSYTLSTTSGSGSTPAALLLNVTTDFAPASFASTLTTNEKSMGKYFNTIALGGTPVSLLPTIAQIVAQSDTSKLAKLYDGLSPDTHLASQTLPYYDSLRFSEALLSCRQVEGYYRFSSEGECAWMNVAPSWRKQDATPDQVGVTQDATSVAGGFQVALSDLWHLGFGASVDSTRLEVKRINSTTLAQHSNGDGGSLGVVVKGNFGANTVSASVTGSRISYDAFRSAVNGATASSEQETDVLASHLRYSYLAEGASWYLKPILDVGYTSTHRAAFAESGAGVTNLIVTPESNNIVSIQPTIEIGGEFQLEGGRRVRLFGRGGMTQILSGETVDLTATFQGAPASAEPFTVSQLLDRNSVDLTAGLDLLGTDGMVFRLAYLDSSSDNAHSRAANIKVSWSF